MAKKKKPYMVFETKEEFKKQFDEIYKSGKEDGFKDGCVWVLSYMYDLFDGMFSKEAMDAAHYEKQQRKIESWRRAVEEKEKSWPGMKNWLDSLHEEEADNGSKDE